MVEMVERARAAFTASLWADGLYDTPVGKCEVAAFRKAMRAAIAAMREPTEAMIDKIADALIDHNEPSKDDVLAVWHSGIDAALAEPAANSP